MATSKAKYPYIDIDASDVEERDGEKYTGRLVNDKPYAGGKYEYNAPDAPDAGGGRGFINPPMAKKDFTGKMVVGKSENITPAERRKLERDMKMASEPIKKAAGGTASSRADGCCKKGKTRGKFV
jgi:hypothetical protein